MTISPFVPWPADLVLVLASASPRRAELLRTAGIPFEVRPAPDAAEVLVCGGGIHNSDLMRRLAAALPGTTVGSTAFAGLDPDWVEAVAFAWLAMRTQRGLPGNLPSVTGASAAAVLGSVHRTG